jgi:hypothetical protein
MKKFFLLLSLLSVCHLLSAQEGVFETYDDFVHNKFIAADKGTMKWNSNLSWVPVL